MNQPTAPWLIVTLREVETKIRDKALIISTLGTLLLIIGSLVLTGVMATRTTTYQVAATDQASFRVLNSAQSHQSQGLDLSVSLIDPDSALEQLKTDAQDAVLSHDAGATGSSASPGFTLTGGDEVPADLQQLVGDAMVRVLTEDLLSANNLPGDALPTIEDLHTAQLHGDAQRAALASAMALVFSFLFYMSALIFGMPIANSVIEEKQNRVVEILASAISLRQLLAGKILGNVILAVGQLLLFLAVGLLAAYLSPLEIPFIGLLPAVAGWFVVFFLGGFLVLAGVWAALGALATRTEDLQQSTGPVVAVLMAVLFLGIYAKDGLLVLASYVPIASSAAMPIRLLSGEVPLWEPLLSLLITLVSCAVVLLFAERIYQRAVMHTGGALSLSKALKLEL